jgi:hypothetical protein
VISFFFFFFAFGKSGFKLRFKSPVRRCFTSAALRLLLNAVRLRLTAEKE